MKNLLTQWAVPIVLLLALQGCGKKTEEESAETPPTVLVEPAVLGAIDHVVTADAVLFPVNQANVTPKISAPVRRTLVNRGDRVQAGQVLAELESGDLAATARETQKQYEQAQATYQTVTGATIPEDRTKAEADVRSAQQTFDTSKTLFENRVKLQQEGALAQKLVDEARVTMAQAQSQLETARRHLEALNEVTQRETTRAAQATVDAAKAHYEAAEVQTSYAQVRAPFAGIVADRPIYPGEMASSGAPLATIVDISQVVARANVPVNEASAIRVGRPARIAGPEGDIPGKVTVVSPAVTPGTTTVEVWVQMANPGETLKPGATVRVSIIAATLSDTVIVPVSALLNMEDGGQKVMVIAGNVAMEHRVNTGVRQDDRVQIVSGLKAGDQVVVSGGLGLEDKARVTIGQPKTEEDDDDGDAAAGDGKGSAK